MSIIEKAVDKLAAAGPSKRRAIEEIPPESEGFQGADEALASPHIPELDMEVAETALQPPAADAGIEPGSQEAAEPLAIPQDASSEAGKIDINISELHIEGILSPEGGRTRLDEEYRMIKRPLLVRAFSEDDTGALLNLIMVSSAASGEGKTFTSMNLAISIAMEMDRTVLMVDADLAKPTLSRLLGVSDRSGFTECLKDENLDLGQYLLRTDVPKLTILPAGKRNDRSTELLASNAMKSRLRELAKRYSDRIILFDSPPLLATSESNVLASQMGQVAIVVEYAETPQYLIKEAVGMLDAPERISLILNKTRDDFLSKHVGGYSYGYAYGKGYGYGAYGDQ